MLKGFLSFSFLLVSTLLWGQNEQKEPEREQLWSSYVGLMIGPVYHVPSGEEAAQRGYFTPMSSFNLAARAAWMFNPYIGVGGNVQFTSGESISNYSPFNTDPSDVTFQWNEFSAGIGLVLNIPLKDKNIEFQTGPGLLTLAQPVTIRRTKAVGIGNRYYDLHHIEPVAKAWQSSIGFRTDLYDGWNFSAYYVLSQVWRKAELETYSSSLIFSNHEKYRVNLPMQFGHLVQIGVVYNIPHY